MEGQNEIIEAYSQMVINLVGKINEERKQANIQHTLNVVLDKKNVRLSTELQDLSRTITILKRTIDCYEQFIESVDMTCDYESFKEKYLLKGGNV